MTGSIEGFGVQGSEFRINLSAVNGCKGDLMDSQKVHQQAESE
jgi:hypothetical protein